MSSSPISMTGGTQVAVMAAIFGAGTLPAAAQDEKVVEQHRVIVRGEAAVDGGKHEGHTISVTIDEGDMEVILDGERVPAARIEHRDGRVIILDEDGKEMENFFIHGAEDHPLVIGDGFDFKFGDGVWVDIAGDAARFAPHALIGEPPTVMLGIGMTEPGKALIKHLRLEPGTTTMISAVYEGLPADDAGMTEFDIITAINGKKPANPAAVREALAQMEAGDTVRLSVIREGERTESRLTLAAFDAEAMHEAMLKGRMGIAGVPEGLNIRRFFDRDGNAEDLHQRFREIIISPDEDDVFVMPRVRIPDSDRIHDLIRKRLERSFRERRAGEDDQEIEDRLDALNELMKELEDALDDVLEKIEEDGE